MLPYKFAMDDNLLAMSSNYAEYLINPIVRIPTILQNTESKALPRTI